MGEGDMPRPGDPDKPPAKSGFPTEPSSKLSFTRRLDELDHDSKNDLLLQLPDLSLVYPIHYHPKNE
jgi:hypothetical protein